MAHHTIPITTVDDIKAHMESTYSHATPSHPTGAEASDSCIAFQTMEADLTFAHQNADVGTRSLSMQRFPWPVRWLARLTGRMVLFLSSVFTFQQSQFNRSLVNTTKRLIGIIRNTEKTITDQSQRSLNHQEHLVALEKHLAALQKKTDNQTKQIQMLEEKEEHLKKRQNTYENRLADQENQSQIQKEAVQVQNAVIKDQQKQLTQYEQIITSHSQELSQNQKLISTLTQDVSDLRTALILQQNQKNSIIPCHEKKPFQPNSTQVMETVTHRHGEKILQTDDVPSGSSKSPVMLQIPGYHHQLDLFYATFTNRFRGTRELIKKRTRVYIPILLKAVAENKKGDILDIGCGRGEWLELMQEHHLNGVGIDLNEIMIQRCVDNGLSVKKQDALSCLRGLEDESLRAITGFHIIEHLPFDVLLELFAQCRRVLKTGGVVIFETPNPGNILVGSHTFYSDPSHRNPLPPELVKYLAEIHDFKRIEILHLNPPETAEDTGEPSPLGKLYDLHFNWPMDYAVIGWKE